jgi:ComF family protein
VIGLALPNRCLHCNAAIVSIAIARNGGDALRRYLCAVCTRVFRTEQPVSENALRAQIRPEIPGLEFDRLIALRRFHPDAPVRSIVHSAKYSGMMRLARTLGREFREACSDGAFDVIIPVPLHRTRKAERGYNQAEELALGIDKARTSSRVVKRIRPTKTQTELHAEERLGNVRGAFKLTRHSSQVTGKRVLIVDDVMTTGATIASVAEVLLAAHPLSISLATLAVADHDGSDTPLTESNTTYSEFPF